MGCKKIPIRFCIGWMVLFTTYINYTVKVNMSMSIIDMTKGSVKKIPECKKDGDTKTGNETEHLPDVTHVIPGLLMMGVSFVGCNAIPIIALICLNHSINGGIVLTNPANPQDLAPNSAGTLFGIMSFIAGMTGFIVPQITGALTMHNNGINEWGWNFIIGGCAYISSGMFFVIFGSVEMQPCNEKKEDAEEKPQRS